MKENVEPLLITNDLENNQMVKKTHLCLSFAIQLLDTHIDFDV